MSYSLKSFESVIHVLLTFNGDDNVSGLLLIPSSEQFVSAKLIVKNEKDNELMVFESCMEESKRDVLGYNMKVAPIRATSIVDDKGCSIYEMKSVYSKFFQLKKDSDYRTYILKLFNEFLERSHV